MCGIVGFIGPDWKFDDLVMARDAMAHRGPDDAGIISIKLNNKVIAGLAHRRLSILDTSAAGHQPMIDEITGNVIILNGEIYNHLELRKILPRREYNSTSDTETLLHAYAYWGEKCLDQMVGMFAFAIWNKSKQEFFLARDRIGKKPLYYIAKKNYFAFASEIKALLAGGFCSRKIDSEGLESFLAYGAVQEPKTIIKDVCILASGHFIRIDESGTIKEQRKYWSLHDFCQAEPVEADCEKIRQCFFDAVKSRLISDVPLGAFLSGGTDSSAIVAAMSTIGKMTPKTFCLDFDEGLYQEGKYAEIVAKQYNCDHQTFLVKPRDLLERIDQAFNFMDQPTCDGINSYFISGIARSSGVTVALSGQGGDEVFAGYPSFRLIPKIAKFLRYFPFPVGFLASGCSFLSRSSPRYSKLYDFLKGKQLDVYSAYAHQRGIFWDSLRGEILSDQSRTDGVDWLKMAVPTELLAKDSINQISQFEICCYLRNTLLRDLDIFSMAHSLEVRVPILDHRLIETVLQIDGNQKIEKKVNKALFVKAMGNLLPREIVQRSKGIFWFPWEQWLKCELKSTLQTTLGAAGSTRWDRVGLKPTVVKSYWDRFHSGKSDVFWLQVWSIYVLLHWAELHDLSL